jgi:hypothetical protein
MVDVSIAVDAPNAGLQCDEKLHIIAQCSTGCRSGAEGKKYQALPSKSHEVLVGTTLTQTYSQERHARVHRSLSTSRDRKSLEHDMDAVVCPQYRLLSLAIKFTAPWPVTPLMAVLIGAYSCALVSYEVTHTQNSSHTAAVGGMCASHIAGSVAFIYGLLQDSMTETPAIKASRNGFGTAHAKLQSGQTRISARAAARLGRANAIALLLTGASILWGAAAWLSLLLGTELYSWRQPILSNFVEWDPVYLVACVLDAACSLIVVPYILSAWPLALIVSATLIDDSVCAILQSLKTLTHDQGAEQWMREVVDPAMTLSLITLPQLSAHFKHVIVSLTTGYAMYSASHFFTFAVSRHAKDLLFCVAYLVFSGAALWPLAKIGSSCDDLMEALNKNRLCNMHPPGTTRLHLDEGVAHARIFCLETGLRQLNNNGGMGFVFFGVVIDIRKLRALMTIFASLLSPAIAFIEMYPNSLGDDQSQRTCALSAVQLQELQRLVQTFNHSCTLQALQAVDNSRICIMVPRLS